MAKKSQVTDGRKYRLALIFAGIMALGLGLASQNSMMQEMYSEFLTGISVIYISYCGGNVGNKWVWGKHGKLVGASEPEVEDPTPPKKTKPINEDNG